MKTKPFDLEAAKNGAKLVTRCGKPARLICSDYKHEKYPLIVLVEEEEDTEKCFLYPNNGVWWDDRPMDYDLLIVKEDGMPDFNELMAQFNDLVEDGKKLIEKLKG